MKIRLYTTLGCHLCEKALSMIPHLKSIGIATTVEAIEIADSDEMIKRYGIRIPVIAREDDKEIDWPFSISDLERFLDQ